MTEAAIESTPEAAAAEAWKDVALLLLGAAADHAIHCGDREVEPFRKHLRDSIEALRVAEGSAQILMNAGEVAQAISHYAAQTQQQVDTLRNKAPEQGGRRDPQSPAPAPSTVDPCTGLPKRADAEIALQRALDNVSEGGPRYYLALFYLHRMALTNARFGEAIGNQVLLFCSQQIATTVTRTSDLLFRWSGPAFVAVLERPESELAVSSEIQRMMSAPFSRFFETSSRSVYLPVKVTAEVIPLFETNLSEVSGRLERFLSKSAGNNSRD